MEIEFPLYALQLTDTGRWLVRSPSAGDPLMPATAIVAAIDEPAWCPRVRLPVLLALPDLCEGTESARLPEWYYD
jgi:hypothetical protein